MSNRTCAKLRNARQLVRENMDSEVFFESYMLSEKTTTRLDFIRKRMKNNIAQADPMWKVIVGESENEISSESEESDNDSAKSNNSSSQMACNQSMLQPSTQFYFTQMEQTVEPDRSVGALSQKCDILESLYESLERNNGRLDFAQLESLSDKDLVPFVDKLAEKLSLKGTYNLCQSMNDMTIEEGMKYLNVLCMHLLLPKIIELEEPSRLLSSAIGECVRKFPNEIQQFIFVPVLNIDLKDTTLITTIVDTFDPQKRVVLLQEFLASVKELKTWHIPVLQNFLSIRFDRNMIDKIIKLFSGKAFYYSKDKKFGKLVLSFLKINTVLSEEQKSSMTEVVVVNETLFKKPIENILKNL